MYTGLMEKTKRSRNRKKVIMCHHDRYIIPLSRIDRWRNPPEFLKAYSVPYDPVSSPSDKGLKVTLVVRSDKYGQKLGNFIELVVAESSIEDATELAGLSWLRIDEQKKQVRCPSQCRYGHTRREKA